ncbi:hypothetical protein ACEPAH_7117 [Sanghuangporus vaninii]
MSYAEVTAQNTQPYSQQFKPDPALLNTVPPTTSYVADDASKVNIVAPDFKEHPATLTSETNASLANEEPDYEYDDGGNVNGSEKRKRRKARQRHLHDAEAEAQNEAAGLWAIVKERLFQPGVAGGLLGVVNVGLLGYSSYALYTDPSIRRDKRVLSIGSVSLLTLLGLEGYAAERYAKTPEGKAERQRAREEGTAIYRHVREVVLRPGVLGGLVGLANVGILGGVGFVAWRNWERPVWDRRLVSAVSVGLLGLWSVEGALAEKSRRESESRK